MRRREVKRGNPSQGTAKNEKAPATAVPNGDGPGLTGLKLSSIKDHLHDLGTDTALPQQERDHLRFFYTREENKLKLRLVVLGDAEKVQSCEKALCEPQNALALARSEGGQHDAAREKWQTPIAGNALGAGTESLSGLSSSTENPEQDEIRSAESHVSLAEAALIKARSELQTHFAELEHLSLSDGQWKNAEIMAKRWELTRGWEAITPDELRPAVEAVRHKFEHYGSWRPDECTRKLCFAALRPSSPNNLGLPEVEDLSPYRRFLVMLLGPQVERLLLREGQPAPVILKSYLDVFEAALKIAVRVSFKDLLDIAKAHTELLSIHPVEWAKRHLEILVSHEKRGIRIWIKQVCDPMDTSRAAWAGDGIFWGSWRAPRLIHMKPAGNTPYRQEDTWTREELVRSEELVEARAEHLTTDLRLALKEVARAAHIDFAKQHSAPKNSAPKRAFRQGDSTRIPTRNSLRDDPKEHTLREAVIKKVQNPHQYKVLSTPEAALYFEVQPRTIYRWTIEGDLRAGARRGSITIESILKLEKRRSRKRQDH
jgi:hypothetical protein